MAYVGTPTRYSDPVRGLASILQGEASSRAGQIAVANVITNRAEVNFSGYGSGIADQAFARNQFQGQSAPTAQSLDIARQTLDGSLERSLPGSLNYAAPVFSGPGATTAGWARRALASGDGVNIGGNVFFNNDRGGTPTYTPGASAAPMNTNDPTASTGQSGLGNATGSAGNGDIQSFQDNGDGSANVALQGTDATDPNAPVAPTSTLGIIRIRPNNIARTDQMGSAGSGSNSGGAGGSAGGSMTVPMAIDAQTRGNASDTKSLNEASKSNTESLNKTSTANTKSGTDKAQSLYDATSKGLSDYFVRLVFIIVGMIALAAALGSFGKPKQLIQAVGGALPVGRGLKVAKRLL